MEVSQLFAALECLILPVASAYEWTYEWKNTPTHGSDLFSDRRAPLHQFGR